MPPRTLCAQNRPSQGVATSAPGPRSGPCGHGYSSQSDRTGVPGPRGRSPRRACRPTRRGCPPGSRRGARDRVTIAPRSPAACLPCQAPPDRARHAGGECGSPRVSSHPAVTLRLPPQVSGRRYKRAGDRSPSQSRPGYDRGATRGDNLFCARATAAPHRRAWSRLPPSSRRCA